MTLRRFFLLGLIPLLLGAGSARAQSDDGSAGAGDVSVDTADVVGTWQGALRIQGDSLRVVFRVERSGDSLTAAMDSPDQGATGIPVGQILLTADTLRMSVPSIRGAFAGVFAAEASAPGGVVVDGQWAQGPARLPLTLRRVESAPEVRRPQTPSPPYPYRADSVSFRNDDVGVTLAGTLTRPLADSVGATGVPAVVLVAGSGGQDRNGTIQGHEPLHVLADYLTRRGVAVLRFDERGIGASGGTLRGATTEDLAGDVAAAVQFLSQQPDVDDRRIGVIGHSEGGLIAPMVANRTDAVDFVVLLAAPGLPGREVLANQLQRLGETQGVDRRTLAIQRGTQQRIFQTLMQDSDSAAIAQDLTRIMREAQGIQGEKAIEGQVRRLTSPWFRFFVRYDPRPALRELDVPVLAVTGTKDVQVGADENLRAIETALESGANPPHTVRRMSGLNHLFQTADTGSPQEYARIEETMSPDVLALIATWIAERAR